MRREDGFCAKHSGACAPENFFIIYVLTKNNRTVYDRGTVYDRPIIFVK